jgi:hypothetical protein
MAFPLVADPLTGIGAASPISSASETVIQWRFGIEYYPFCRISH